MFVCPVCGTKNVRFWNGTEFLEDTDAGRLTCLCANHHEWTPTQEEQAEAAVQTRNRLTSLYS